MDCEIGRINAMFSISLSLHTDRWWNVDLKTTSCLPVAPQFISRTPYILCCSFNAQAHTLHSIWHFGMCFSPFVYIQIPIFLLYHSEKNEQRINWRHPTQFIGVFVLLRLSVLSKESEREKKKLNRIYFVLCRFFFHPHSTNSICMHVRTHA